MQLASKEGWCPAERFEAGAKGYGVRATAALQAGDFILEYLGEVINQQMVHERMDAASDEDRRHFYMLELAKGEFIDASYMGNIARFINHSCLPNATTQVWEYYGEKHLGIFAARDIAPGEELGFDYNWQRTSKARVPCLCGAPNCRGFLGADGKEADRPLRGCFTRERRFAMQPGFIVRVWCHAGQASGAPPVPSLATPDMASLAAGCEPVCISNVSDHLGQLHVAVPAQAAQWITGRVTACSSAALTVQVLDAPGATFAVPSVGHVLVFEGYRGPSGRAPAGTPDGSPVAPQAAPAGHASAKFESGTTAMWQSPTGIVASRAAAPASAVSAHKFGAGAGLSELMATSVATAQQLQQEAKAEAAAATAAATHATASTAAQPASALVTDNAFWSGALQAERALRQQATEAERAAEAALAAKEAAQAARAQVAELRRNRRAQVQRAQSQVAKLAEVRLGELRAGCVPSHGNAARYSDTGHDTMIHSAKLGETSALAAISRSGTYGAGKHAMRPPSCKVLACPVSGLDASPRVPSYELAQQPTRGHIWPFQYEGRLHVYEACAALGQGAADSQRHLSVLQTQCRLTWHIAASAGMPPHTGLVAVCAVSQAALLAKQPQLYAGPMFATGAVMLAARLDKSNHRSAADPAVFRAPGVPAVLSAAQLPLRAWPGELAAHPRFIAAHAALAVTQPDPDAACSALLEACEEAGDAVVALQAARKWALLQPQQHKHMASIVRTYAQVFADAKDCGTVACALSSLCAALQPDGAPSSAGSPRPVFDPCTPSSADAVAAWRALLSSPAHASLSQVEHAVSAAVAELPRAGPQPAVSLDCSWFESACWAWLGHDAASQPIAWACTPPLACAVAALQRLVALCGLVAFDGGTSSPTLQAVLQRSQVRASDCTPGEVCSALCCMPGLGLHAAWSSADASARLCAEIPAIAAQSLRPAGVTPSAVCREVPAALAADAADCALSALAQSGLQPAGSSAGSLAVGGDWWPCMSCALQQLVQNLSAACVDEELAMSSAGFPVRGADPRAVPRCTAEFKLLELVGPGLHVALDLRYSQGSAAQRLVLLQELPMSLPANVGEAGGDATAGSLPSAGSKRARADSGGPATLQKQLAARVPSSVAGVSGALLKLLAAHRAVHEQEQGSLETTTVEHPAGLWDKFLPAEALQEQQPLMYLRSAHVAFAGEHVLGAASVAAICRAASASSPPSSLVQPCGSVVGSQADGALLADCLVFEHLPHSADSLCRLRCTPSAGHLHRIAFQTFRGVKRVHSRLLCMPGFGLSHLRLCRDGIVNLVLPASSCALPEGWDKQRRKAAATGRLRWTSDVDAAALQSGACCPPECAVSRDSWSTRSDLWAVAAALLSLGLGTPWCLGAVPAAGDTAASHAHWRKWLLSAQHKQLKLYKSWPAAPAEVAKLRTADAQGAVLNWLKSNRPHEYDFLRPLLLGDPNARPDVPAVLRSQFLKFSVAQVQRLPVLLLPHEHAGDWTAVAHHSMPAAARERAVLSDSTWRPGCAAASDVAGAVPEDAAAACSDTSTGELDPWPYMAVQAWSEGN